MTTLLWSLLFLLAAATAAVAGELFLGKAEEASKKEKMSPFVSGILISTFLVALPEIILAIIATWKDYSSMVPTYVTGANLINLLLIPGLMALTVGSFVSQKEETLKQVPYLLGGIILFLVLAMDGQIDRWEGAVLLLGFIAFAMARYADARLGLREKLERLFLWRSSQNPLHLILLLAILIAGAFFTVTGVIAVSEAQNWNPGYLASTVVALVVSAPEIILALRAAKSGNSDKAIGVLMASTILNVTVVIALSAFVKPLNVLNDVVSISNTFMLLAALLFCFSLFLRKWSSHQGAILILIYLVFLVQFLNPLFS